MKATFLIGGAVGLVLAVGLLTVARFGGHTFGWEVVLLWPAVLPFGSNDPEQEITYVALLLAVLLNGCIFAAVAAAVYLIKRWFRGGQHHAV